MALNKDRLKQKVKDAFTAVQNEEQDHQAALDHIAEQLATAIIEEIKQLTIAYNSGLLAPNGTVTGTFNATLS